MPPTYTVQITFDYAKNLPVADLASLSSDPYILASVEVPDVEALTCRTPTIQQTRDPTWNCTWFIAGVPEQGFKLKMVVYDEDAGSKPKLSPDRLGKAVARFGPEQMKEGFESLETEYVMKKRKGDLHPYILTYLSALRPGQKLVRHNRVVVSMRVLRKDEDVQELRLYTLGPNRYSRHFSPLLGSVVNKPSEKDSNASGEQTDGKGVKLSATTFIANKLQLTGPVPRELRHRYVGYKPFISWMFDDSGIAGRILNYGLHKQYHMLYACNPNTVWGTVDDSGANSSKAATPQGEENKEIKEGPVLRDATPEAAEALARQFLDMTAWGEGGKLFTYVITLDGEWRFTETGPEFCIDLLSKHSMHANLAKEIAYSGEFFVRKYQEGKKVEANGDASTEQQPNGHASSSAAAAADAPQTQDDEDSHGSRNPKDYELVIDNDSGTYRPKKELLPVLHDWLSDQRRLGGLGNVCTMDGFDENLQKMKEERKKEKLEMTKKAGKKGNQGRMALARSGSSMSSGQVRADSVSSEEVDEALRELENEEAKTKEEGQKEQSKD
ncbi:C2 domain-containing protein [Favolaschia claudopus]|uniref:C2 domain-containing protein n=1 Tax=Favolaschia claudopus TaxID=2862362 RepID=A0AAW0BZ27_9AGAR